MPMRQASRKAPNTRAAEIRICSQSGVPVKPFCHTATNFCTIACGDGRNSGLTQPMVVTAHQTKTSAAMVAKLSIMVSPWPGTP